MSNYGTFFVYLGKAPEDLQLGGKDVVKLRCSEKAGNKRAETRWFTAIVGGPDVEAARRLAKGDMIALAGELVYKKYRPKNAREDKYEDEMPFAKLAKVIKSPTFFGGTGEAAPEAGAPTADAPAGDTPPDLDDLD